MDRRFLIGGGLSALGVMATSGLWLGSAATALAQESASGDAKQAPKIDTSTVKEMVLGQADAPVTLMEYGSFTCPHCSDWHNEVYGDIKKNYIDTGKVKFVFRDVYFDRYGLWAALIARCDPMRFFGIADMLYEKQKDWLNGAKSEAEIADNLRKLGKVAGLSDDQLDACLSDETKARTLVAWYQENAKKDDITGTPSFLINGTKYSNMSYADMSKLLDEALKA
ncbi:DsbA family protein [Pseudooceanicola sp. CBS1P-1]|uniref:Thioredoxin domain-containing protein n=1 Tax=Pseudooceanicola albus TaxID=2692189 RepID=A0A6L7G6Y8_9RHOB|nr:MULTISPECIES: DsbA family protein [Pseudooceanicola]MBT9384065.1 DsbA family protein [Pseudooceanicola endophyticus]MXN19835.1 thioredoxin domain-containing protein [Pseudooceanicola albus]